MSIRAGQVLWIGDKFVVDRVQTGGLTNLNFPWERVFEDGNPFAAGLIRDIPDLTWEAQSFDVSTDIEALMVGVDPSSITTGPGGTTIDFLNSVPLNVISPFKSALHLYDTAGGLVIPCLSLETVTYRYGLRANAQETFTLRGDSVYYMAATPVYEEFAEIGTGPYTLTHTAEVYHEVGDTIYVLGLDCLHSDGTYQRLFHGTDYTDTTAGFTLLVAPPAGSKLRASYFTDVVVDYPLGSTTPAGVKPAAVRARDLDVYVEVPGATPVLVRWDGVQSFDLTRKVTLDNDEEFGNRHYVTQDYDQAVVSGSIGIKPRDVSNLFAKIAQVTNTPTDEVAGVYGNTPLGLEARVYHPDTGAILKTLYVPDALFTTPAIQVQVGQKHTPSMPFESQLGDLQVFKGAR